jgi:hypothetical protein
VVACLAVVACSLVGVSSFGLNSDVVALKAMIGYSFDSCSIWRVNHEGSSSLCGPLVHITCIVLCVFTLRVVVGKGRRVGPGLLGHLHPSGLGLGMAAVV